MAATKQQHIDNINANRAKIVSNAAGEFASKRLRDSLPTVHIACDQLVAEAEAMTDDQLALYGEAGYQDWGRVISGRIGKLQAEVR